MILADDKIWDQNGFNELVRRQLGPSVDDDSGLVYAYDGNLKLGLLPASIFCSGHTYFVQAMFQHLRLEAYDVHTTFQYAGTEGKRHRLREAKVFYDPPEYYNPPGGLLTFKPAIPKNLLLHGEHSIDTHFALVHYQVIPPLWCRLDRLWFGHPGILPGSLTRPPFVCPLDHVFEINVMLKEMPNEEFGPGISIREYSIFENPSMPQEVKKSWLDVHLCQEGSPGCQTAFSKLKDVKVIQFSSMQDAFDGFTDKTREEQFRSRVKRYVGIWCCVENHTPGHIYYDMYWDEKPGWKAAPPNSTADDHPPW
ncbi:hypothetical protein K7X08_029153 [Anisodus acutangulus]|uniref:Nucleotide-diphospho-sugar transferase domain-containing protein n=1 Tax=Anisodus acutangulus TaxID=402998 RepID=A0A9Q1L412_9SOLA|nr:hypothetical protein K7X08_029153 [Anisodus acutangulus]